MDVSETAFSILKIALILLTVGAFIRVFIMYGPKKKRDVYLLKSTYFYRGLTFFFSFCFIAISLSILLFNVQLDNPESDTLAAVVFLFLGVLLGISGIIYKKLILWIYKLKPQSEDIKKDVADNSDIPRLNKNNHKSLGTLNASMRLIEYVLYGAAILSFLLFALFFFDIIKLPEPDEKNILVLMYLISTPVLVTLGFLIGKINKK